MPTDNSSPGDDTQSGVIGERRQLNGTVYLAPYNPQWLVIFSDLAALVLDALADRVKRLEHVGSTSVESLIAKPVIDMLLVVEDSSNESAYVPQLEAQGFSLRRREPEWYEHRLLRYVEPRANLHVFSAGCPEIDRMLTFRDRLRENAEDRLLYENSKRKLAVQTWTHVQDYANAKTEVVREILGRAQE